jgi:hypothetical protein
MEWRTFPLGSNDGPLLLMHAGVELARVDRNRLGDLRVTVGRYRPLRFQHMRVVRSREEGQLKANAWLARHHHQILAEVRDFTDNFTEAHQKGPAVSGKPLI